MRSILIVCSICIIIIAGLGLTLAFWQIPIPISEKVLIIPNEKFAK
tara:strand:+ start:455 stop:592 length:138 start_codon:yes stop_codon:yes gene_type:complete